ncbi:MAG: YicC/YloC family endoribonuclease [Gemmatimonadaceae bacterium]
MIRSMTGFGASTGRVGSAQVAVELRTVNHRFFNSSIRLPSSLARWEGDVREVLRRGISRGHVTLAAKVEREQSSALAIDETRFEQYLAQLRALQKRHGLEEALDVATVLRLPDVIVGDRSEDGTATVDELTVIVEAAVRSLRIMREWEGARLAAFLAERLTVVEQATQRIALRAPERMVAERDRMRRSVRELADGVALDEGRIAQEVAVLADRLDVSEELERFRSHLVAFRSTLETGRGEPVGKRLGFLLQEMLREANTTGSKAKDVAMLHEVVAIKEELERIAEQVENLE